MTTTPVVHEFDKPLTLTTPLISGKRVNDVQWLLVGHNELKGPNNQLLPLATLTGPLDGTYGPVTAGATKEAKYEIGYPTNEVDSVFGQKLYDFLTGSTPVPADFMVTREARLAQPKKIDALNFAITQIGIKEQPFGSNRQKYGAWYGLNGEPWCAIFASYCINEALGTMNDPKWKYSYVPNIASDAANGAHHMALTYSPQPGDLVTYDWDGPNCHVEFYEKPLGSGSFSAVGGNTGSKNFSNGGEVSRSTRYTSNVSHFIRLSI